MTKYKILAQFVKDISSETPNIETYLFVKDRITKYKLGIDINSKAFIRDIGFINESLKSVLFRELGYDHPLSELVKHIIVPVKSKDKRDIYTKFRADTVVEILDYLEGIEDEEL